MLLKRALSKSYRVEFQLSVLIVQVVSCFKISPTALNDNAVRVKILFNFPKEYQLIEPYKDKDAVNFIL